MQYVNREKPLTREERAQKERERLEREEALKLRNNRLGLTLFQGSWIMVFVCLLVVYWFMGYQPGWRPTPEQAPGAVSPTLATIGLVLSAFLARRSLKIIESIDGDAPEAKKTQFFIYWQLAILLGAIFFLIMMTQFFAVPASTDGEQFGYIYRTMIGYHAIHAVAIGFMMIQIWRYARDGRYHAGNSWSVEATTKLWYFVVVAWLMFYAVLYLPYLA